MRRYDYSSTVRATRYPRSLYRTKQPPRLQKSAECWTAFHWRSSWPLHERVLSIEQIANKLDDVLQFLRVGSRTAPARQQTLRATLD